MGLEQDGFSPQYGSVNWKPRLNNLLEATGIELIPMGYTEGDGTMQLTQENCVVYINQVADEMDCVAVKYDGDDEDIWTWYFREKFVGVPFEKVVGMIGVWVVQTTTLYPMEHVVLQYEKFADSSLGDELDDLLG